MVWSQVCSIEFLMERNALEISSSFLSPEAKYQNVEELSAEATIYSSVGLLRRLADDAAGWIP
jgi:hypothetical protein